MADSGQFSDSQGSLEGRKDDTRDKQRGFGRSGRWNELFATPDSGWPELLGDAEASAEDWRMLARRGGFPTPALELKKGSERRIWFYGYVRTYLERG